MMFETQFLKGDGISKGRGIEWLIKYLRRLEILRTLFCLHFE